MQTKVKKPDLTFKFMKSMMNVKGDDCILNYTDAQKLKYLLDIFSEEKKNEQFGTSN
jgi:hypothetical protein